VRTRANIARTIKPFVELKRSGGMKATILLLVEVWGLAGQKKAEAWGSWFLPKLGGENRINEKSAKSVVLNRGFQEKRRLRISNFGNRGVSHLVVWARD